MAGGHALLGASKAHQWINCPPSARLQENIQEKPSQYAEQGTAAHELAEIKLKRNLLPCNSADRKKLDKQLEKFKVNGLYDSEMENAIQEYVDHVGERLMEARARSEDAVLLLEEKLDFTEWVPEGFGTGDVVMISDGVMEIIDLKYGKGKPVSAYDNPQIRLYALGAWNAFNFLYDIEEVRMTIIQPRLDSITTDTMTVDELLEWAETVVKPAAKLAFAGEGEYRSGDHCQWCKVNGNCRARADENMKALEYEFKDPALLSNDEVGSILFIAQQLKAWAKDIEDYAQEQALKGEKIPQWKLVEGRSNRTITDKDKAIEVLKSAGYKEGQYYKPKELITLGELEKLVGKKNFGTVMGDLVIKPPGKPVLVPETDKRPELNSIENDFESEDFTDESQ
ncbi:DUF2800 domain-containing protein [Geosporobacter ferrireducens]|uniref:DUF2800 domain-containing protein n=1 Tax=Geosporobacter ferrireducens TaxID=1424294 RepID=UPI00139AEEA6|nr:DUF2800 domain-containing protein [Geosporobacter ferrireducens]MTI56128.1 DUF2800 domain-containing protein [Geosporobacter ferrireducens]